MVSHLDPPPDTRAWAETTATFYRRERPDAHFRTSSSTSSQLADAVVALLAEHPAITAVVEVGAGVGVLLEHLRLRRPGLRLAGVDLRDRPVDLHRDVAWLTGPVGVALPLAGPTLVLACELLDDVPLPAVGRDDVWVGLLGQLGRYGGLALAVDYVTPPDGSSPLLAYRDGQQVEPALEPHRNLTAPVDLDAVRRSGEAAGARTLALLPQSAALARWLPSQADPADQPDSLAALVGRSERHALASPRWLGAHWWLLQEMTGRGHLG